MLLMMGAVLQPLDQFVIDADLEISDTMDTDSKDSLEKEHTLALFLVEHSQQIYVFKFDNVNFNNETIVKVHQQLTDIVLPPPEC